MQFAVRLFHIHVDGVQQFPFNDPKHALVICEHNPCFVAVEDDRFYHCSIGQITGRYQVVCVASVFRILILLVNEEVYRTVALA